MASDPGHDLVALDDALEALAKLDERKSRVIELRFFGGLSVEETFAWSGYATAPSAPAGPNLAAALLADQRIDFVDPSDEELLGLKALGTRLCAFVLLFRLLENLARAQVEQQALDGYG